MKDQIRPSCECGNPGSWHGDNYNRRTFCCDDCWAKYGHNHSTDNPPFYVQSEQVRGERRQYWVEDRRTALRYRKPITELTPNKRTAEKQCERLNKTA